jgi:copper chaperone CopZ
MPEIVHVWNNYVAKRTRKRHEGRDGSVAHYTTIELTIPTMGCVACINKIDSSIRNCAPDKITDATSWLEPSENGGRALVRAVVSTKEEAESLANTVAKSVQAAGFEPCIVESIHTRDP